MSQNKQNIPSETLIEAIRKIDNRFEMNISLRQPIEQNWVKLVRDVHTGKLCNDNLANLCNIYTAVGDSTLPSFYRKKNAQGLQWLDSDFFYLEDNSKYYKSRNASIAIRGVEKLLQARLNDNKSNFKQAITDAFHQSNLLNFSAVYDYWHRETCHKHNYTPQKTPDGKTIISRQYQNPSLQQGLRFQFINVFNLYPDYYNLETPLHERDLFHRSAISLENIYNNPDYDTRQPYWKDESMVLYRGTMGLADIERDYYMPSNSQQQLMSLNATGNNNQNTGLRNLIEVRTAYIDSLKIGDETHKNLKIVYVKKANQYIPLLIEYNHFAFDDKPIRMWIDWINPYDIYAPSALQIAYNDFAIANFYNLAMNAKVGEIAFGTKFISEKWIEGTGLTEQEFADKALKKAGTMLKIDDDVFREIANPVKSLQAEQLTNEIAILAEARNNARNEIQTANQELTPANLSGITATAFKGDAESKDQQAKQSFERFCTYVLKPIINNYINTASQFMESEQIRFRITENEIQQLLAEQYAQAMQYQQETGKPPTIITPIGDYDWAMSVDFRDMEAVAEINRDLLNLLSMDVKINIENNTYSKPYKYQEIMAFYNQVIPASPEELKPYLLQKALKDASKFGDIPDSEEILEKLEQYLEQQAMTGGLTPEQQAQIQLSQVQAGKAEAETRHLNANSMLKEQEAGANNMIMGI